MFGRVVLIPFIEGERSPKGVEAQQLAESRCEEVLEHASSAVGTVIAVSQDVEYICKIRSKVIRTEMAHDVPHVDGRCMKNYALLIGFAEKVICLVCMRNYTRYKQ